MSNEQTDLFEKIITHNGKTFRYRFTDLSIEQGEIARELGEFKAQQIQTPVSTFNEVVRSQGDKFLSYMACYLLLELDNDGKVKEFNREYAENEVLKWTKSLKMTHYKDIEEIMLDFFTSIERGQIGSLLCHRKRKVELTEILPLLMTATSNNSSSKNDM